MKPQLVTTPEPPDLNAILAALQEAMVPTTGGDPGFTTSELAERTNLSERTVVRTLRRLHAEGRLVVGRQYRQTFNGRRMPHTVYRLG